MANSTDNLKGKGRTVPRTRPAKSAGAVKAEARSKNKTKGAPKDGGKRGRIGGGSKPKSVTSRPSSPNTKAVVASNLKTADGKMSATEKKANTKRSKAKLKASLKKIGKSVGSRAASVSGLAVSIAEQIRQAEKAHEREMLNIRDA